MKSNWLSTFTTTVCDDLDNEHEVIGTYQWIPPRAATYWEPEEGGVEIESVESKTLELTQHQIEYVEQECIDAVWEDYHNKGYDE